MPLSRVRRQTLKFELKPLVDAYLSEHPGTVRQYKQLGEQLDAAIATEALAPIATDAPEPVTDTTGPAKDTEAPKDTETIRSEAPDDAASDDLADEIEAPELEAAIKAMEAASQAAEQALANIARVGEQADLLVAAAKAVDDDSDDDALITEAMEHGALMAAEEFEVDPSTFVESVDDAGSGIEIDDEAIRKLGTGQLKDDEIEQVLANVEIETGIDNEGLLTEDVPELITD